MKRQNEPRRSGVVLLLILGLMAMFAISVLSYMVMTSNMAETAQNAQSLETVVNIPEETDIDYAFSNLIFGSYNDSNPIAPFSILENMYGNWSVYDASNDSEKSATSFKARMAIFPNLGYAVLTPCEDFYGNDIFSSGDDYGNRKVFSEYFEGSGNVMTLGDIDPSSASDDALLYAWNADVVRSSAYVLEKVITNPSSDSYVGDDSYCSDHYHDDIVDVVGVDHFSAFDYWHFKIELTDDLKKFLNDYDVVEFNRSEPVVTVRLNRPAFSGTGAGGFAAGSRHDSTFDPLMIGSNSFVARMNLPYAFWMNASAPDMWPYYLSDRSSLSFRSFWAHLADVNYDPTLFSDSAYYYTAPYDPVVGFSKNHSVYNGFYGDPDPVRMNPSYTAPDAKTPFLAHYFMIASDDVAGADLGAGDSVTPTFPYDSIIPSFHRPEPFKIMNGPNPYGEGTYLDLYRQMYSSVNVTGERQNVYLTALLRKLTPRPLPLDHWNFTGGNPDLDNFYFYHRNGAKMTPDEMASTLGNSAQWDVDNDNDGVREGIWIPSGLPIRYDKNGTPYATMFSYTVLDLDGRVNVNTAGNWDQLPNKMASGVLGAAHPYNYVDELQDVLGTVSGSVSVSSPLGTADDVYQMPWGYDDLGDEYTKIAERGSGFTASGVLLYEAIAAAFGLYDNDKVQTVASNLLWRRYLGTYENPEGIVDTSSLSWGVDGIALNNGTYVPQPGSSEDNSRFYGSYFTNPFNYPETSSGRPYIRIINGNHPDGFPGIRSELFSLLDPIRLKGDDNTDSATIADANMVFPWRGKTTVSMSTRANLAPAFDWADTAFRSYDPLGAQFYSYAPRYSANPHLAFQNSNSLDDTPYSSQAMERILRPRDSDAVALPNQLADDLDLNLLNSAGINNTGALPTPEALRRNVLGATRARMAFTTISSDVPAASVVFPENFEDTGEIRYGNYGFIDLIRRNVRSELERVFEVKDICDYPTDSEGNVVDKKTNNYLYGNDARRAVFNKKVDEITAYLASMLPKEILAGEKIDLNALSQKNYWLDLDYNYFYEDAPYSDHYVREYVQADRNMHNIGLVKRMEYARGLYIVVMTLLYEDMNGHRIHDPNDTLITEYTDEDGVSHTDESGKLSDYIEGSFDLLSFKDDDKKKDLMGRELMATRIAQWCVNVVDFSDPDATMTPFFFDPTPFDGWWVEEYSWIDGTDAGGDGDTNLWKTGGWNADADPVTGFLFPSDQGLPSDQMYDFFLDALNGSEEYVKASASVHSVYYKPFKDVPVTDPTTGVTTISKEYGTSNELVAQWLSKKIDKLEDQTSDLGFRLVWGMERPDLVLTETLNFHDLGIADTEIETDVAGDGLKRDDGDETFDQVRRPEGSSYLELYCTANPNVPQSRELYDYDEAAKSWKLRLSKTTPAFIDKDQDGNSRELDFPIWRVAISDSADPRGRNVIKDGMSDDDKKKVRKSSDAVYHKARNSVLDWLTPHKIDSDKYSDDIDFFSMQPRQFRNAPMPTNSSSITNIASLDLDQGTTNGDVNEKPNEPNAANFLSHWKDYNLLASNTLGSAVAATYDDPRLREVELDRILWFSHPEGDTATGTSLGTAGKFPDALRTFGNKANENVYLKPNQYLVVGPEKKRSVGSAAAKNEKEQQQFGQDPNPDASYPFSFIDLETLLLPYLGAVNDDQKYQYMEAVANIGGRGFNISEPLWTSKSVDPYYADQTHPIKNDPAFKPGDPSLSEDDRKFGVRDIPFEIPSDWADRTNSDTQADGLVPNFYDNRVKNYPIVKDEIFGLGTIPAYKSAFVQRVADPNRPYHPVMNPYITVDWNMMDLTVFTGEVVGETLRASIDTANEKPFSGAAGYKFGDNKNKIKLDRNLSVGLDEENKTIAYSDAFSSRQWGAQSQKAFAPGVSDARRPNPWARAVKAEGDKGGLEEPMKLGDVAGALGQAPAHPYVPKHTLGFFNDHGDWGKWVKVKDAEGNESQRFVKSGEVLSPELTVLEEGSEQYKNLNYKYMDATDDLRIYRGAPRLPFEHLVWNDAPFSNPYELMMVPSSASGRFGLEFVRREDVLNLKSLYKVDSGKKGSLGSYGFYGFDDWYTDNNIKQKASKDASGNVSYSDDDDLKDAKKKNPGSIGPYLNFFASSKKPGETLNLVNLLDLVRTPSYYLGSRKLAGVDANGNSIVDDFGNPLIYSSHRDPGKVNINTLSKPVWHALVNTTDRLGEDYVLPGTPWDEFLNSRFPYETQVNDDGEVVGTKDLPFTYFQPAHTTPLWTQLDGSTAPIGTYSTLLAQQMLDTYDESSVEEEPLLDNVRKRAIQDDAGNDLYWYRYRDIANDRDVSGNRAIRSDIDHWEELESNGAIENLSYGKRLTSRRGNIYDATAEMQRLSGLTTTRSNVFAAWVTVGYFELERCNPGVNMPDLDPDGNTLTGALLRNPNYKWYHYYQAIYPDGFTYGKELGEEYGETKRHRGFTIIDRSIPVDFRRGFSVNYEKALIIPPRPID